MKEEKHTSSRYTIRDDKIFGAVMDDPILCAKVVQILARTQELGPPCISREKFVGDVPSQKSIRMDILCEYSTLICDIEMQKDLNRKNLFHRIRAYFAIINAHHLKSGEDYRVLKDITIVFICFQDPFGKGKPVYRFDRNDPDLNLRLNDGETVLIYNCSKAEGIEDEELRNLLLYFRDDTPRNPVTKEIHMKVERLNLDTWALTQEDFVRVQIQGLQAEARDEGEAFGLSKGLSKGLKKGERKGVKKGMKKKALFMAKQLKEYGMPMKDVLRISGLSEQEYQAL